MSNTECTNAKVESKTLCECPCYPVHPHVIHRGHPVVKIPVVLSECELLIDVEGCIYLEHPAYEIKRIKKELILTQAKLIPTNYCPILRKYKGGRLYLKGYIKKNIEYATVECSKSTDGFCCMKEGKVVAGDIKHTTAYVGFNCSAGIHFIPGVYPIVKYRQPTREIEIFRNCQYNCFGKCYPQYIGSDLCQYSAQDHIGYTEGFDIELENVDITEIDIEKHCCIPEGSEEANGNFHPHTFNKLIEKIALNIKLKILQKQQVRIHSLGYLPVPGEEPVAEEPVAEEPVTE
ncbi:CsxC family protein [Oceanirhabdus sp. W0125-5]|uniref:CsxC family protein n=1 Tax=Oceanirhabdus sp. W0125-5 TaxID=2999116 RepID=UPI0022F2BB13|nr:hypothetical protein [Oceanirhabdus sp. W0125-5]WBW97808.1 hypothetical protein OW730_03220 [Oceanirhabdus sp. W0125-5]